MFVKKSLCNIHHLYYQGEKCPMCEKEKYVNMSKQYNVKNDVSDEKEELNDDYIMKLSQKFNVITKKQ